MMKTTHGKVERPVVGLAYAARAEAQKNPASTPPRVTATTGKAAAPAVGGF